MEKAYILKNKIFFISETENILNNFKSKLFPMKHLDKFSTPKPSTKTTPNQTVFDTPTNKSKFKLYENFMNEILKGNKYI